MNSKIRKIRSILKEKGLDALLITNEVNTSYLTGLAITDSCVLFTRNKNIIMTDFRYLAEVGRLEGFSLERVDGAFINTLASLVKRLRLKRIGFEGASLSYSTYTKLKKGLKGAVLVSTRGLIEEMRMVKGGGELKTMQEAIRISRAVFAYIRRVLKPGVSEAELAKKIDIYIRSNGGEGVAFPTIVASGPNGARPHAVVSKRKVKRNEPIIIDLGVRAKGYNSDLTRTFYLGKIDPKFHKIYEIIYIAQQRAISYIKPGRSISAVDRIARTFIAKAGFSGRFGHALGHGVGREVHESPKIFKTAKNRLLPGMVFTVEPAVYIPGWGGVRIEDMVLVTKDGCKVLTDDIDK